jgi:hypothetical protein
MKAVIRCYADHANHQGRNSFPGIPTVARETEIGERTVQRKLRKAESEGWLVVERKASQHRPTTYRVNMEKLKGVQGCQDVTPESLQGCQDVTPEKSPGVTSATSRGDNLTPESVGTVIESTAPRADARAETDPLFWKFVGAYPRLTDDRERLLAEWTKALADGTAPEVLIGAASRPENAATAPEDWLQLRGWTYPAALAVVEPSKPAAKPSAAKPPVVGNLGVQLYVDAYRARYGGETPPIIGRAPAILKHVLKKLGEDGYRKVIANYFATADPFVLRQRHPVGLIESQVNKWRGESGDDLVPPGMIVSERERRGLQVIRNAGRHEEALAAAARRRQAEARALEASNNHTYDLDEEEPDGRDD